MCITIKVIIGLILLIQAWRLVSKGGKRTLVGCLCIWFAIGALGSAALDIFRIVGSGAPQQSAPTATPTPTLTPTPTSVRSTLRFSDCDFNCEQYADPSGPFGWPTQKEVQCWEAEDACKDYIIEMIERQADSWEREMKEPQNGLSDLDKYDPSDWDPMW